MDITPMLAGILPLQYNDAFLEQRANEAYNAYKDSALIAASFRACEKNNAITEPINDPAFVALKNATKIYVQFEQYNGNIFRLLYERKNCYDRFIHN